MSPETIFESVKDDPDFAVLNSKDEYAQYFNLLSGAFKHLLGCYRIRSKGGTSDSRCDKQTYEASTVALYLSRLLSSIEALRVKYSYTRPYERSLWVDLTESGFPNFAEISALSVDLQNRKKKLHQLPASSLLKRDILDLIFEHRREPEEMLQLLSERTFFEMLDERKLFLPFVSGEITRRESSEKGRSYLFSWACYDFITNRPFINLMTFDQSSRESPLETSGADAAQFLKVMESVGSRAPDVGVLALAIDDALEHIHPKILKRICVGPLYSRFLLEGREGNNADLAEKEIRKIFSSYKGSTDDFILFFTDEIVFSKRQQVSRSLLSPTGKIREIFAIEESDTECYARRASVVHHYVLLPHRLLQHIEPEMQYRIPSFARATKLTFDEKGVIHGI